MGSFILGAATVLAALIWGTVLGYHLKSLSLRLDALTKRLEESDKEDEAMPQVITAKTPQEVYRSGDLDDESAIVVAKKPRDIQRDKDLKLNRELDELQ